MPTKRPHDTNAEPPSRNLGAPRVPTSPGRYVTGGGITVDSSVTPLGDQRAEIDALVSRLDSERGCMFESSYEFPGRYARWTMGFVNPPLCFEASGRTFAIEALNARGEVLVAPVHEALSRCDAVEAISLSQTEAGAAVLRGSVKPPAAGFAEEQRSRQHSIFSLVRALRDLFSCEAEPMLGLYGAFGYDLTFQFEPIRPAQSRVAGARDLLLYLPDELLVVDIHTRGAWRLTYDFTVGGRSSAGLPRSGLALPYVPLPEEQLPFRRDHAAGAFASKVARAKKEFEVGNLFEVVLSQNFAEPCPDPPSAIFRRLRSRNPSPYGFLINLGPDRGVDGGGGGGQPEYLVGASPEMFVRVERDARGWRCETCPISGTIRRGADAMEDAKNIQTILADKKEESELTMCTDVDRNDKSRICEAGSVTVIGRRQIEMYSRLIHTVDHVEGYLRDGFDAMDAFLAHTWAVTVTGAPKPWAIQFVEDHEESPRHWYGGAVGCIGFDGCLNTGLTLRTVRIAGGFAQVRAGATLLYDSEPAAEEKETELKASAMRDAVLRPDPPPASLARIPAAASSSARVVLVDHQDSFVHTLANYLRQTGALVTTLRFGFEPAQLDALQPTLAVLSPGPGKPADFDLSRTIELMLGRKVPLFGVCLGLQGMVEHFGGSLGVLSYPQHGKPGSVRLTAAPGDIFAGCPTEFQVGRYHSLYSQRESHPACLRITAETTDGVIMGIQHAELPLAAVQFHPESILTRSDLGVQMLVNAANKLRF